MGLTENVTEGFHWHIYSRSATEALSAPTPAARQARLAEPPDVVLRSPIRVAEWVIQQSDIRGERCLLWCPASTRWTAYDGAAARDRLHTEAVQLAARAHSIYLAVSTSAGQRFEVFAEGVTVLDCPQSGRHDDHEYGQEA